MVYQGEGRAALLQKPRPVIQKSTDAIVRVTLSTICSSDIHILHGAVPRAVPGVTLGHEFVGVVEETGKAVHSVAVGDRVAVNVETFCGDCFFCKRGYVNNCTDPEGGWALGCRIDGGQAEYARIPFADQGLTRIPEEVSDEEALFTGDLLSTGYWAAQMVEIHPGWILQRKGIHIPSHMECTIDQHSMGNSFFLQFDFRSVIDSSHVFHQNIQASLLFFQHKSCGPVHFVIIADIHLFSICKEKIQKQNAR